MRLLALFLALGAWFCSAFPMLAALAWGLGLECDDSCSSVGGWRHDPDAWQWNGMAALGVVVFLAGAALFFCVLFRRPIVGALVAIVGFTAMFVLANAFSTDWIDHLDRQEPVVLLAIAGGFCAPIFAVLLTIASANPPERA